MGTKGTRGKDDHRELVVILWQVQEELQEEQTMRTTGRR